MSCSKFRIPDEQVWLILVDIHRVAQVAALWKDFFKKMGASHGYLEPMLQQKTLTHG